MDKKQVSKEKAIVLEMTDRLSSLKEKDKLELLRLKCRTDFLTFAQFITRGSFKPYAVHRFICGIAQKVADGEEEHQKTQIALPPRSGKSLLLSKLLLTWQYGRVPHGQFILSSHSKNLVHEHTKTIADYLQDPRFSKIFPDFAYKRGYINVTTMRTTSGGLLLGAPSNTKLSGFGYGVMDTDDLPGIGLCDDIIANGLSAKVMDSVDGWMSQEFIARALSNYALTLVGTIYAKNDPFNRLISRDPTFAKYSVPALCTDEDNDCLGRKLGESHWPEKFPVSRLEEIKRNLATETDWNCIWLQKATDSSSSLFDTTRITWFDSRIVWSKYDLTYTVVDASFKATEQADNSCVATFGIYTEEGITKIDLIDVVYEKMDFYSLQIHVKNLCGSLPNHTMTYIEEGANGHALISEMQRQGFYVTGIKPIREKAIRAQSILETLYSDRVKLNRNLDKVKQVTKEIEEFPNSSNDDFVDALTYGLMVFQEKYKTGFLTSSAGVFSSNSKKTVAISTSLKSESVIRGSKKRSNFRMY